MKAAIVCQDIYEYNMQKSNSPLKSGTGRQIKYMYTQTDLWSKEAEKTGNNLEIWLISGEQIGFTIVVFRFH